MVLIGLLLVAVVFVVLGIVQSSVGWIIASLVASALAAGVMVWSYLQTRKRVAAGGSGSGPDAPERSGTPAAQAPAAPPPLEPSDGAPRAQRPTDTGADTRETVSFAPVSMGKREEAEPAGDVAEGTDTAVATSDIDVLVIDGQPRYHLSGCSAVIGNGRAEPIPLSQALEDGFVPCPTCTPPRELAGEIGVRPAADGIGPEVWVADGHPEFHREGCSQLQGLEDEPIPLSQALEDGFVPCTVCRPTQNGTETVLHDDSATAAPAQPAPGAAPEPTPQREADADSGRETVVLPTGAFANFSGAPPAQDAEAAQPAAPEPAGTVASGAQVWVADGYPEYHVDGCSELAGLESEPVPYEQAVEDGFQPCVVCNPDRFYADGGTGAPSGEAAGSAAPAEAAQAEPAAGESRDVWVVDGFPDYHREDCPTLVGLDSEPVPHDQAVEDGFTECSTCRPEAAETPTYEAPVESGSVESGSAESNDVWVVDGFPDYHREDCPTLVGLDAEPVPHDQAVEDGFTECSTCRPEAAETPTYDVPVESGSVESGSVESGSVESNDVWVVDGFPDYHREDCPTLVGLDAEPVPHDQAVEDGFTECSTCRPEAAEAPTYTTPDEPAAVEEPETEPTPEPEPEPESRTGTAAGLRRAGPTRRAGAGTRDHHGAGALGRVGGAADRHHARARL